MVGFLGLVQLSSTGLPQLDFGYRVVGWLVFHSLSSIGLLQQGFEVVGFLG